MTPRTVSVTQEYPFRDPADTWAALANARGTNNTRLVIDPRSMTVTTHYGHNTAPVTWTATGDLIDPYTGAGDGCARRVYVWLNGFHPDDTAGVWGHLQAAAPRMHIVDADTIASDTIQCGTDGRDRSTLIEAIARPYNLE